MPRRPAGRPEDARRQEGGRARCRHARVGQVGPTLRRVRAGGGPRRHGRCRARLARHAVRLGRRHHPQRLPGLRVRGDLRPGAGVDRGAGLERLRGLRIGRGGHRQRAGADPGRAVRRGAGGRRRHDAQGLLRPGRRRRPQGRPGLVALPSHGRHQPDLLRPVRAPAHGPLRRHRGGLRTGQGEERAARAGQPLRALPQGGDGRRGAGLAHGGRPAAPARDLRHLRRRGGPRPHVHGVRPAPRRRR